MNPSLFVLDEPTSGLDSSMAATVIECLKNIARRSFRTILCTVHSPSSQMVTHFDRIFAMLKGRFVFQGSAPICSQYLASIGFPCPNQWNITDHLVELLNNKDLSETLISAYKRRLRRTTDGEYYMLMCDVAPIRHPMLKRQPTNDFLCLPDMPLGTPLQIADADASPEKGWNRFRQFISWILGMSNKQSTNKESAHVAQRWPSRFRPSQGNEQSPSTPRELPSRASSFTAENSVLPLSHQTGLKRFLSANLKPTTETDILDSESSAKWSRPINPKSWLHKSPSGTPTNGSPHTPHVSGCSSSESPQTWQREGTGQQVLLDFQAELKGTAAGNVKGPTTLGNRSSFAAATRRFSYDTNLQSGCYQPSRTSGNLHRASSSPGQGNAKSLWSCSTTESASTPKCNPSSFNEELRITTMGPTGSFKNCLETPENCEPQTRKCVLERCESFQIACSRNMETMVSEYIDSPSYMSQVSVLFRRGLKKDCKALWTPATLLYSLGSGLIIGFLNFQSFRQYSEERLRDRIGFFYALTVFFVTSSYSVTTHFNSERLVLARERLCKAFYISAYVIASTASQLMVQLLVPTLQVAVAYAVVGFPLEGRRIFGMWLAAALLSWTMCSLTSLVSVAFTKLRTALTIWSLLVVFSVFASGTMFDSSNSPAWLDWARYFTIVTYVNTILLHSDMGDKMFTCAPLSRFPSCPSEDISGNVVIQHYTVPLSPMASCMVLIGVFVASKVLSYAFLRYGKALRM
eukprot:GHVT01100657.1.p1 GENE.GHVT01100657.1~~GHVT01100657.1.p1  ORF type:complete len:747 (+),score=32.91 GHVT01100657.1:246-2486(+)